MLARFFIARPIFAWVIAIVIMLGGLMAIRTLPVAQYPDVAPPQVSISATYTGASAETVENSVTQVLEQQLTGIDGLLYFSSSSSSAGTVSIDITFEQGTDPDTAQVQVQNKVQQALARLPQAVQQQGVTVTKSLNDFLMVVTLYDASDKSTASDTADYLVSNFQDPLARVLGVGNVQVFGSQYAMRIWLDPVKLAAYDLMPSDVSTAVEAQNTQVSAGKIGGLPAPSTQELNATVTAQSRLQTAEQFRNIILKYDSSGATLRLGDVARVELGSETYDVTTRANGHPASGMAIKLAPGANALQTAERVRAAVAELSRSLPPGYKVVYAKDSTPFIRASIQEVVKTLFEAIVLVVIVMFVFLQNWRATLIPAIAVPVVMLGTFGVLQLFGYSINTLTLFGLVLAIGLLVDDAIVVVENVERVMREEKLPPKEATLRSMNEITGALIGIAAVLSAVFLPMAFFSGSTGVIYRQFSVTIVASMALSVIVAITLTPALCATLLKEHREARGVFARFNSVFERVTERYVGGVAGVNRRPVRFVVLYGAILGALGLLFMRLPTGFLPDEDQGEIMVQFVLPTGASAARSLDVAKQVENYFLQQEGANVDTLFTISGFNFSGSGQNAGMAFIALKDWSQRKGVNNGSAAIVQRATKALSTVRDARVLILNPASVQGLGQTGGFESQLLAAGGTDRTALGKIRDEVLRQAIKDPKLMAVRLGSQEDAPQLHLEIDTPKANSLGVATGDINDTLSAAWGGTYINDFVDRSRVKKVYMQGDAMYRSSPEDLNQWYVRNSGGGMTPFSAFASSEWTMGPENLPRFNGVASYSIQGSAAPGVSSGAAMTEMEKLVKAAGNGATLAWSGLSYQERLSGGQAMSLYAVSILVVFLCLAALYESWSIPLSVLLVIPLGVIGCVTAISLRGLQNDVYFQVALLTTIGLAAKNAILIIEFAEDAYRRGTDLVSAALEAARQRLRPVLMTSLAFIAGVAPLAIATGAGANSRIAIGTGIIGGTLTATVLALFLVPLFFVLVSRVFGNPARLAPIVLLSLSGCVSLDPHYERPASPVPATWPTATADDGNARDLAWQSFVKDERLREVINTSLTQSRTLRETVANIESARAQYRVQRASQFPQLSADATADRSRTTTGDTRSNSLEAGLSAFEIDLFGKQRSLSRAAFESYLATTEAARATRLSLIAETATAYVTLAADTSQLAISRQTMQSAQRSMELTQRRLAVGVASAVDVKQAETIYQQARADVETLTATCAQDRNALELLAGTQLEDRLMPDELPTQNSWFASVPAGLSSEILLQRPDVLEAEHTLKSANANIGVARAAFFPSISLTASGGLASSDLSQLITKGVSVWSVTPTVTLPLFTGGSNTANLDYMKAQKSLYVSTYELTVQTAFKEVANALAVRATIQGRLDAQGALVTAASDSYTLAEARYRKGVDTFLNALDSQRTLYSAQQTLITTRQTEMENVITLYQALGGGLEES